jgi:hygromycin-B 4-O-kinase
LAQKSRQEEVAIYMSNIKAQVSLDAAKSFLNGYYSDSIQNIRSVKSGEQSQAFLYDVERQGLVLRVHKSAKDFYKDKFAYKHFASAQIPIPSILDIGKFDEGHFYAISKRLEGKLWDDMSASQRKQALPSLVSTLDAIHSADISFASGYGGVNEQGNGSKQLWADQLQKNTVIGRPIDDIFQHDWVDKALFAKLKQQSANLIAACPEIRQLVHADFGYDNLLVHNGKVSGVLDWGIMCYGDPVLDVAWLQLWSQDIDYDKLFYDHFSNTGQDTTNYSDRLLCYMTRQTIGALAFLVFAGKKKEYLNDLPWLAKKVLPQ